MTAPTASERLAAVFTARQFHELNPATTAVMKRLLLDFFGVALAGSETATGIAARDFAISQGTGRGTIIGDARGAGAAQTAFANAVSGHSVEFDDIDSLALSHYGVAVIPAALAAADLVPTDGKTLLLAITAGCEALARISAATNPELRDRGFHTTSACGVFAGAASAALVLGLSEEHVVNALGLAGAQASGVMEIYGASMQKRFNPGFAARNSVSAALLARAGVTGERTMIDGPRGFAMSFSGRFDSAAFDDRLGEEIPFAIDFKPYACVRPIHTAIDAALSLRPVLADNEIVEIEVFQHPSWAGYFDSAEPRSVHEAQVSLPYSIALALTRASFEPKDFDLSRSDSAEVLGVAKQVKVAIDPSLDRTVSGRVRLVTATGEVHERTVDYALGSSQNPMSDLEIHEKFSRQAIPIVGTDAADRIFGCTANLEYSTSISALLAALQIPTQETT